MLLIIPELIHEYHVFIQLFSRKVRHARARQETLVRISINLHKLGFLPLRLLESLNDLLWGIVICAGQHILAQHLISLEKHSFHKLPRIATRVEEGDGCCGCHSTGEGKGVRRLWGGFDEAFEIRHEEAGHEEGGWDAELADVVLDAGFTVEVVDILVFAASQVGHVVERGEDQMLDAFFL